MKKIGIITALILIFAVGMLWSDTSENYTLKVDVSFVETLHNVRIWYIAANGNQCDDTFPIVYQGETKNFRRTISTTMSPPVSVHARGFRANGQHVSVSKPADNWIYETIYLTIPELPYVDPTIPEND